MNTRYDLNMEVPPREAVRLLYISKSRFGGDWRSVPHTHACTEMFYCVSGRGQFNIEGKLFDVAPDDLIIVNPRVQHTELSYQTYPLEYIVLGIDGAEFLFNEKDLGYTMLSCGMMREELLFLMRMLLREIDSRADGCEMVCQDILEVLLVKIVREAAVSMRIVQPPSKSKECAAAKRYIDENFSENITLDKLDEITAEVEKLAVAGQHFLDDQFGLAQKIVDEFDYNRIVYLGNIGLKGVAQESALKTLELTAGKVATMYDSELGFRHGPKSIIDDNTLTVAYLSDDEYRRRYELDLVKEMAHQRKGNKIAVVYNHDCEGIEELADYPVQIKVGADMENVLLGLDFILFAQTIALMKSLSLGITPDNPCPTGEVNRVVKGVTLYPYTLK